ncbi:hypothetical protein KJ865_16845, partial [Myxococcota bacterium]|nr:hypothetical protein [Myxococcota bacterium]
MHHKVVVSICGSSGTVSGEIYHWSQAIGRGLAERGVSILCGGRDGVMEAVCHGVSQALSPSRGLSIALLPSENRSQANTYADIV